MYRLLGDMVVDVQELIDTFEKNGVSVYKNVTNATKRDDAIGLKLCLPIKEFSKSIVNEDNVDDLMLEAERVYRDKISALINENFRFEIYSYGYDEIKNSILLNFVMMDSFMQKKLKDVMKRLFDI